VQWAAADCAAPSTANAGQYATSRCKPMQFGFPCKWWYINVGTFNFDFTDDDIMLVRMAGV